MFYGAENSSGTIENWTDTETDTEVVMELKQIPTVFFHTICEISSLEGLFNNHHFTTTNTSQQVEFFHSLILVIQHKMTEFERSFQPFMSKNLGIMGYFWKNWKALSKYGMKLNICTFRGTNSIDIRALINHSLRRLELSLSKVTKKQYYFVQKKNRSCSECSEPHVSKVFEMQWTLSCP